jgi:hypothetical protein
LSTSPFILVFLPLIGGVFVPWLCCCLYFKCLGVKKKVSIQFAPLLLMREAMYRSVPMNGVWNDFEILWNFNKDFYVCLFWVLAHLNMCSCYICRHILCCAHKTFYLFT